ncbi:outer membrane beta-barrel protein [Thiothrix lacustris]|uniref:Outer membrane beta-barrel protein n=1 Tax=Thiothrix lacustris TaxID=525917 RepID=A0ABY9MQX6_9GAMM|nr:outer membrane beta-barrel protein [Thiothrix lacustris]WML91059.1 outer membrane beta-barrel protein [Thiothrix lacustris]WMP17050.1 outer membrane beta-barrel protein [Thiothrix lacustris]
MTTLKTISLAGLTVLVLSSTLLTEVSANSLFAKSAPMSPIGGSQTSKAPNYLGASIGKTTTDDFCQDLNACESADQSWKAFAGVRVNDSIVLESGYVAFGKQSGQDASGTVSQTTSAYTATAVVGLPVSDQIEAFGKAGMARWSVENTNSSGTVVEDTGNNIMVGAGANYDLGDNMGVRAEWERYKDIAIPSTQQTGDIDLLSLGFIFSSL